MMPRATKKPTVKPEGICKNCYHYKPFDNKKVGACRRYPPQVVDIDDEGNVYSSFPLIPEDELCCGEFSHGPGPQGVN